MAKVRCLICTHPQSAEIDRALAMPGASMASVAKMFGVHWSTLGNHQKKHIPTFLAAVEQSSREVRGLNIKETVFCDAGIIRKSIEACDRWMTDPDNPDQHSLEPRASEIPIIYEDWTDMDERGNPTRKKLDLQSLIEMATTPERRPKRNRETALDVRDFMLKSIQRMVEVRDQWAKLHGAYQADRKNEFDEREFFKKEIKRLQAEGWEYEQAVSIVLAADDTGTASQYVN